MKYPTVPLYTALAPLTLLLKVSALHVQWSLT